MNPQSSLSYSLINNLVIEPNSMRDMDKSTSTSIHLVRIFKFWNFHFVELGP